MPTIKGNLLFVSSRAAQVSEVWVRAPKVRTHAEGLVTTGNDHFPVIDGQVEFTAVPGPAVLALISQGRAVDTIPIVVGDAATQTLRQVVNAAEIADDATKREIEKLAAQAIELVDSSTENARKAQDGATRAETAVGAASESAASAAASEQKAAESEQNAAKSASGSAGSATQAAGSAAKANQDADRAANIANSTSWNGDKLTVNGKTSPSLRGPKGDRGADGTMTFEDLTPEQRETLKGDKGEPGPPGPPGNPENSVDKADLQPPQTQGTGVELPWVYKGVSQTTDYYCGPASIRNAMATLGKADVPTQGEIAALLGTSTSGTEGADRYTQVAQQLIPEAGYQRVQASATIYTLDTVEMEYAWRNIISSINAGYPVLVHMLIHKLDGVNFPTVYRADGTVDTRHTGFSEVLHYATVQGYKYLQDGRRLVFLVDSGWEPHGYYLELSQWWDMLTNKGYWWPESVAGTGLETVDELAHRFGAKADRAEVLHRDEALRRDEALLRNEASVYIEADKLVRRKASGAISTVSEFNGANGFEVVPGKALMVAFPKTSGATTNAAFKAGIESSIVDIVQAKMKVAEKTYVDEQVGGLRDRVGALESGGSSPVWTGSKAEYDQISPKEPDTIYIVR